jgi:hypothetical protein
MQNCERYRDVAPSTDVVSLRNPDGFKTIDLERRIPQGMDPAKFGGIGGIGVGFEETEGGLRKVSFLAEDRTGELFVLVFVVVCMCLCVYVCACDSRINVGLWDDRGKQRSG